MDEQSLNAYLNLVNALLTCPSGQEGEVLSANQELIDAHLVHIMEQVAEKLLVENGNEDSAIFLQNLADKIADLFANLSATNSEEYFKFLLNLLQAISDSDANLQVVYPILQANIDKLNAQLVEVLQTWGSNYLTELLSEEAQNLASALCDFGNLLQQFPRGHRADNLEIAIVSYQTAMIIFNQKSYPIEWAMTHINLGSAYTNRICGEKAENVEKAISAFCCALTVITPISFSRDWATCQINLGRAYYNRIKGVRGQNLENTIVFYQAALQVYNRQKFPDQWASLQNSLGNAYSDRIIGDRAENVEIAINYYQSALQVYTRENFPDQWATTQNNLGTSYNCRILGKRLENLEQAIHCYQDALQIRTREAFPQEWAATQNNLAAFYSNRIQGDRSENLEMAISCYENVLEVYSIEAFPYDWAMIQNNLGNAYSNRIREDKVENLERAIACFNAALQIRTRDQFPENWAISQNNLGTAYSDRLRGDKADNLERAIACFKAALEVYTRSAFPQNHAETLLNLGLAYRNLPQLQLAYDTFDAVINTVEFLRSEIRSGDETKQKLAEKWNKLYLSMVEVCLGIGNYTKGMEYAERSKAYNLVELLTTRDLYPKRNLIKPISFSEIQQLLIDKKTIIIEWYVIEDKFVTFIVTSQADSPYVWQSSAEDKDKLINWVEEYLQDYGLNKNQWQDQFLARLHRLTKILHIDQIISYLPDECDRLILIPHRFLHLLPLHALPLTDPQYCLLDRFPRGVSYAPSCQLLQLSQNRNHTDFKDFFAIQNPSKDLSFTEIEVETIRRQFQPNDDVLVNEDAKKEALDNDRFRNAHCIHFSCHGYFDFESPLDSALILADATNYAMETLEDNSYEIYSREGTKINLEKCLTLREIFDLDLRQCRLVTLSACETGLIDFTSQSDEYIGLPSGFLVAGSSSVVSSLWAVNDFSTSLLMIKFYDNLQHQASLATSLCQAQLWLRDATIAELEHWIDQRQLHLNPTLKMNLRRRFHKLQDNFKPFQEPFYWAAFCLVGQA